MRGPRRLRPRFGGIAVQWLVLLLSLGLTVAASAFVAVSTRQRDEARFANAVQSATDRIIGRLDIYISTLRGAAALFAADDVSADEFRRFIERLELQRWYPGVQGIGWSPRIERGLAGDPDERYAITYLEPQDERNRAAMGYDMYSEERRREAMRRARDMGEPALSAQVFLMQEISRQGRQPGFLLYLPVYRDGQVPADVEQRREQLLGFAYAPFRAHDLFRGIFGTEVTPRVSFAVYDGTLADPAALLVASSPAEGHRPRHRTETQLQIAGRTWTVAFASQPEFEAASARSVVPLVVLAGLVASGWLFLMARAESRARGAAEHASRAKSTFLATMSHELRTPLNAIGGYVDLMQLGVPGPTTELQQHYLERIKRAQHHLLVLINDVLDFARIDAGRVEYRLSDVGVQDAVAEAVSLVQVRAAERGVGITTADAPAAVVRADPERLRQVLLNLLTNAVKFTAAGGRVTIGWHARGAAVDIMVTDTGIGIPVDRLDSVFEPFLQVDSDLTREREGAGLGLAISRDLARGMGGDVTAASQPGAGSTFTVSLPRA